MSRNLRRAWVLALALAVAWPAGALSGGSVPDRLQRFRELVTARLDLVNDLEADDAAAAYGDVYALLDEEIVENLASGGVFASLGFLQDRLDAFAEAWGGAAIRVHRLGPLLVGAFELGEPPVANSVRIYGQRGAEPALLGALFRAGRPAI
ncbi:MAG TPA: hypothetical protein VFX28_07475, partial [Methylomirabilota bacterium]|nr:hypothetical protein [Methylomirabilota bacterium]